MLSPFSFFVSLSCRLNRWLVDFLRESSIKTRVGEKPSFSSSSSTSALIFSRRPSHQKRAQEQTSLEDSQLEDSKEDVSTRNEEDEEKNNKKEEKKKESVSMENDEGRMVTEKEDEKEEENCMKTHTSRFDRNTAGTARSRSCTSAFPLRTKNRKGTVETGLEERVRAKEGEGERRGEGEEDRKEEKEKLRGSGHCRKVVILNPLCDGGRGDRIERRRKEDKRKRKGRNTEKEEAGEGEELFEGLCMAGRENEGSVASFLQAALGRMIFVISSGVSTAEAGQILHHFLKEDSANVPVRGTRTEMSVYLAKLPRDTGKKRRTTE